MDLELLTFWFDNEQLWFNCSKEDDELVTKKFSEFFGNFKLGTYG